MPSLNMINILADVYFVGQNKKLPVDWKQPQGKESGDGKCTDKAANYADAFTVSEKMGIPEPLCYFWPASRVALVRYIFYQPLSLISIN